MCCNKCHYTIINQVKKKEDINPKPEKGKEEGAIPKNERKIRPEFWFILAFLIIILFLSIMQLVNNNKSSNNNKTYPSSRGDSVCMDTKQNKEPLLVFAGGGSVKNYLLELDPKILEIENSINIAMASGSAWRVLPEEYHKSGRFNEFNTICLSAKKIEASGNFYKEYISYLKNAIVAEVYLGEDPLVAYISDSLMKYWGWKYEDSDSILLDTLAQRLQKIVENNENNISIFSTNKTSGTLEQYKKSFQELQDKKYFHEQDYMMLDDSIKKLNLDKDKDTILIKRIKNSIKTRSFVNLEKMIDDGRALTYYDKTPSNCIYNRYQQENSLNTEKDAYKKFIILGSKYYNVKEFDGSDKKKGRITKLYIINDQRNPILKPMFLYFLAYKDTNTQDRDVYKVEKIIIEFLKKIERKIEIKNKEDWNKMMDSTIIEYDSYKHSGKIVTIE